MKRESLLMLVMGVFVGVLQPACGASVPTSSGSCATFALSRGSTLLVGHNLDENIKVPGLIVLNPQGVAKENVTFGDLMSSSRIRSAARLRWVSRYGSVTYNVFGREFPDGGMNEAGLYVGEMTLMTTVWPENRHLPRMYHHQWMQYLLDNCATVDEALASLSKALPEGHCKWHFFVADREGRAAVVEFLKEKPLVYAGGRLPHKILCNDPYDGELRDLPNYQGFGGTRKAELRYQREDPRFRWAAVMLRGYDGVVPAVDYVFAILKRLDTGNNKWALVFDIRNARVYFRTSLAPRVRWVDFADLDFACSKPPRALDINRDLDGNVEKQLAVLTQAWNRDAIGRAWAGIDAGFMGNLFFKPRMVHGLGNASVAFSCTEK